MRERHAIAHRKFERPRGFVSFEAECQEAQKAMGVFPLEACLCGHCYRIRNSGLNDVVRGHFHQIVDLGTVSAAHAAVLLGPTPDQAEWWTPAVK